MNIILEYLFHWDSYVFGPLASGSVIIWTDPDLDLDSSISKQKKIKINCDIYWFVTMNRYL